MRGESEFLAGKVEWLDYVSLVKGLSLEPEDFESPETRE